MALAIQANTRHSKENNGGSHFGITEILIPSNTWAEGLVLPMLAHLSRQNTTEPKWFTWISPYPLSKKQLDAFDFNRARIRWIRSDDDTYSLWLFWEALSNGNSDTVVAELDSLSESQRVYLEQATALGETKGIVMRNV